MKINSLAPQNNINSQQIKNNTSVNNLNSTPAFKGSGGEKITKIVAEKLTNKTTDLFTSVAKKKPFQNAVGKFARSNNTFAHLMVVESALLSGFYMFNTLRNKKIDKEQKPQMLINDALVWGASTASTYLVENKISSFVADKTTKYLAKEKVSQFYNSLGQKAQEASKSALIKQAQAVGSDNLKGGLEAVSKTLSEHLGKTLDSEKLKALTEGVKSTIENGINGSKDDLAVALKDKVDDAYNLLGKKVTEIEKGNLKSGVDKLKTLVIFGLIYRFIGPVVMTPIANKLSAKIKAKRQENKQQNNPQATEVKK